MRTRCTQALCMALAAICLSLPAVGQVATGQVATNQGFDLSRGDIQQFIDRMVQHHRFDRADLTALLTEAKPQPRIIEAIQRPAERTLAWWEYRSRFLTNERIDGGVRVWRQHAADLARIAAQTGVPAEYLVAITGVETFYGRNIGRYRVLDSLTTLGFGYPPRSEFFLKELEQFLMMTREEELDPRTPVGSYAGAMGIPQFMPSSFRRFAVDGSGDGHRNLWLAGPDVFASVANYLREHGWRASQPVLVDARIENAPDDPAAARLTLDETVASLRARGYQFDTTLPEHTRVMLVPAQFEAGISWRVGFENFYAITRYNRSALYAMAVNDLAQEVASRYRAQLAPPPAPAAATTPQAAAAGT